MSLTVRERLQALLDGKKIRLERWGKNGKISLDDELIRYESIQLMSPDEKWEIYQEPALELTPDDLGRKVELRGGNLVTIIAVNPTGSMYRTYTTWLDKFGRYSPTEESDFDIIKVL